MSKTKKITAPKFLAFALLSGVAFLASTGPASASDDATAPAKGTVAEALASTIGPDAAGSLTKQVGPLGGVNKEWRYNIDCHDGVGTVYVYGSGGTHAFASFVCEGDWFTSGVI